MTISNLRLAVAGLALAAVVHLLVLRSSARSRTPPSAARGGGERGRKKKAAAPPDLFVFGLGYCGSSVARAVLALGGRVAGTVREDGESAAALRALGATVFVYDPARATLCGAARARLQGATHVLSTAQPAPVGGGGSAAAAAELRDVVLDDAEALLRARLGGGGGGGGAALRWLGYLSTTGVYGDRGGDWVDESTAPKPSSRRGVARVAAERRWAALGLPLHVFRLPGIYGPGRGPLAKVRSGTARSIDKPGQYFSRIHVEDITLVLLASMARPTAAASAADGASPAPAPAAAGGAACDATAAAYEVFNVVDDEPCAAHVTTSFSCELLGLPAPALESWEEAAPKMSAMARSFWGESKRVRNGKLKLRLGVLALQYPTYREGLLAQLQDEEQAAAAEQQQEQQQQQQEAGSASCVVVVLVDNGSVRAGATLALRNLARRLARRLRQQQPSRQWEVVPTSARHSNRVPAAALGARPAELLDDALQRLAAAASARPAAPTDIVVAPLFIGPGATASKFVPDAAKRAAAACSPPGEPTATRVLLAPALAAAEGGVAAVARMVVGNLGAACPGLGPGGGGGDDGARPAVLVLDHGSPTPAVAQLRDDVAAEAARQLAERCPALKAATAAAAAGGGAAIVRPASMERRPGPEYAFADPLLEDALAELARDGSRGAIALGMLFLLPGKHAGAGGDVADIVAQAEASHPALRGRIRVSPLLHESPALVDLLAVRVAQAEAVVA